MYQSAPLSATIMPYFLSALRIDLDDGGKPEMSKLGAQPQAQPHRRQVGVGAESLAKCVAG